MANGSDVSVSISVDPRVAATTLAFIEATDKDSTYNLMSVNPSVNEKTGDSSYYEVQGESAIFNGGAEGRWSYSSNLEGYLDPGSTGTPEWVAYDEQTVVLWRALMDALRDTETTLDLSYTEVEAGNLLLCQGAATVEWCEGDLTFNHHADEYDFTIENLLKVAHYSLTSAVYEVCGWTAADTFEEFYNGLLAKGPQHPFQLEFERVDFREALLKKGEHTPEEAEAISHQLMPWFTWKPTPSGESAKVEEQDSQS